MRSARHGLKHFAVVLEVRMCFQTHCHDYDGILKLLVVIRLYMKTTQLTPSS